MVDSTEAFPQGDSPQPWLLLIHSLPPKPDYFRVKVRRRLRRLGAIPLKNTVYALPSTDEAYEDFTWLAREISADGGEATLLEAILLDAEDDAALMQLYQADQLARKETSELESNSEKIPEGDGTT